ncbi:hypothetical protein GCM10009863_55880 [Streptomyces axinellae]|uniref:Uncharacterized protein n=1 Tax=Streptomyces axinellae TaxID=552788 RepID=A0ABN3QR46_9ACTN
MEKPEATCRCVNPEAPGDPENPGRPDNPADPAVPAISTHLLSLPHPLFCCPSTIDQISNDYSNEGPEEIPQVSGSTQTDGRKRTGRRADGADGDGTLPPTRAEERAGAAIRRQPTRLPLKVR